MSLRRIEFARWVALTTGRTTLLVPCCCTAMEELLPVLGMAFLSSWQCNDLSRGRLESIPSATCVIWGANRTRRRFVETDFGGLRFLTLAADSAKRAASGLKNRNFFR